MSPFDPGCVKIQKLKLRVEILFRFRRCEKLAASFGRMELRKQFCASLARPRFHATKTHLGHSAAVFCRRQSGAVGLTASLLVILALALQVWLKLRA